MAESRIDSAVLSNNEIVKEMMNGNIIIENFNPNNLSNCSYDVTLGEFFYRHKRSKDATIYNVQQKSHMKKYWGDVKQARVPNGVEREIMDLGEDDKFILLQPNELILAHTNEFIGGRHNITTMMKTRSTMGRCGVECCGSAGWGDVGYINRYTMEIKNNSNEVICLTVGMRIAQIVFLYTSSPPSFSYEKKGHYQLSSDIIEVIASWKPEMMLPQVPNDSDANKNFDEIDLVAKKFLDKWEKEL
jgi:dCTP deaminase